MKGVIYYTDSRLGEPIFSLVQKYIKKSGLPIVTSSLLPMNFGENEVFDGERSYPTMVAQIISCLERSAEEYVFFCENDVLYPKAHFDFTPPRDDIFYYNKNVWRWLFGSISAVKYYRMIPLSSMCVNRELALEHYQLRARKIKENGWDKIKSGDPRWVRKMGYEPGTKKKRRGGLTDDDFETWESELPIIDIRHKGTFSPTKIKWEDFKHKPKWWEEILIEEIPGWDLKKLFSL